MFKVKERATPMSTVYIRCEVYPGLFESEWYVLVNHSAAYHVHRDDVKIVKGTPEQGKAAQGEVRAYLINREAERALVQLPGEAAVGGLRTWVENADLLQIA